MCCEDDQGSIGLQFLRGPFWKHSAALAVTQAGQSLPSQPHPRPLQTLEAKPLLPEVLLGRICSCSSPTGDHKSALCTLLLLQWGRELPAADHATCLGLGPSRCFPSVATAPCTDIPQVCVSKDPLGPWSPKVLQGNAFTLGHGGWGYSEHADRISK